MPGPLSDPTLEPAEKTSRHFLWVGVLMALVYAALLGYYTNDVLTGQRVMRELFMWLVVPSLIFLYAHGYRVMGRLSRPVPVIVGFAVLFAVLAVLIPPFHSTDLFGYINRGWQQIGHGVNPYVMTVSQIPGWEEDPVFYNHWVHNPSPYGFLYMQMTRFLAWLGGGDFAQTLAVFKGFNLVLHGLSLWLVWWGVRLAGQARPERALYLYGWSPLILLHALGNGHNDLVMGLFVLLSFMAAMAAVWLWIIPALVAGTFIKYGAVVILPFAGLFLYQIRAWRAMIGGMVLGFLIFILSGWTYLQDWAGFNVGAIRENAFVTHASLHSFVFACYRNILKLTPLAADPETYEAMKASAHALFKNILLTGYGVFYLGALWHFWKRCKNPGAQDYLKYGLLVMVVLVCGVSPKFYPWYLAMFFAAALLLEEGHWLRRLVVLISVFQLFAFTFVGQAHFLNFLLMLGAPIAWVARQEWRARHRKATARP